MNRNSSTNMIGWTSSKTNTVGTRVRVSRFRRATSSPSTTASDTRADNPDGARRSVAERSMVELIQYPLPGGRADASTSPPGQ